MSLDELLEKYAVVRGEGCWLWGKSLDTHGYGQCSIAGKRGLAHRAVFRLATGIDPAGRVVMHTCDTPACVNPKHLKLGTQLDNIRDRVRKGRSGAARGDNAPWSKLSSDKVKTLRRRFDGGECRSDLARAYGISKTQMYRVVKGESWANK
jgi:hypothetical protein